MTLAALVQGAEGSYMIVCMRRVNTKCPLGALSDIKGHYLAYLRLLSL